MMLLSGALYGAPSGPLEASPFPCHIFFRQKGRYLKMRSRISERGRLSNFAEKSATPHYCRRGLKKELKVKESAFQPSQSLAVRDQLGREE